MASVTQTTFARPGQPSDGEERADVRERQREDGVLDAHERREASRERHGRDAHVCRCVVEVSPAASSIPCRSAGSDHGEAVAAAAG